MNTTMIKHFGIIALGGVAGGLVGYFLAELIINQMTKEEKEFEKEEEKTNVEIKVGKSSEIVSKKDYTKYATKGDLSELADAYKSKNNSKPKQDNIRIISIDEFDSNKVVAREPISYYEGDTTFCNANEEIIPNPEDFFGPNIHLHFGEESDDPDIVYVKNENNGVSYEITRFHGKYHVIVLGMPDEEPKVTKAKRRRTSKKADLVEDEESTENEGED